ncbi:HNH endonuclease [Ruegeria arenilitoris]|uniref:HNH endonuclease n=1 Tax=Ruegeria arenilitoris TaxID=1173585 RepID=UPI00147DF572
MIKLEKLPEPAPLARHKERWTTELLAAIASGNADEIKRRKSKYNHADIKEQLKSETKGKCAYCESKVTVVAYGDIEHITPKSIKPELTFEWENLTFACQKCNGKKSTLEDVVDPYSDDVDDHFFFVAEFIRGRTPIGRLTERELELNRVELIEDRCDHLKVLADTLETIANEPNERIRTLTRDALISDLNSGKPEYIKMKRGILAGFAFD